MYVDNFSGRAVQYNLEAEQAQDQELLINIVRASLRRPLAFSGVQTVAGTATAQGQISLSWPLRILTGQTSTVLDSGGTVSGGPTFTVGILDTQEFYQGILGPIKGSILDFYYHERYSRTLLFNLFVSEIVIRQPEGDETNNQKTSPPKKVLEIQNYPGRDADLDRFQFLIDYLLNLGLSTEPTEKSTSFGPLFSPTETSNVAAVSRAAEAGLNVQAVAWCDLTEDERAATLSRLKLYKDQRDRTSKLCILNEICEAEVPQGCKPQLTPDELKESKLEEARQKLIVREIKLSDLFPLLYRVERLKEDFRLCFQQPLRGFRDTEQVTKEFEARSRTNVINIRAACGADREKGTVTTEKNLGLSFDHLILADNNTPDLARKLEARLYPKEQGSTAIDFKKPVELEFDIRSTEGVIYYLGEVVRRELYPDFEPTNTDQARIVSIKYTPRLDEAIPEEKCIEPSTRRIGGSSYRCVPLFLLNQIPRTSKPFSFLVVSYDGSSYTIPTGINEVQRADRTTQVLDIVTQLVGLNKSAKNLPTTSVFTLTGVP